MTLTREEVERALIPAVKRGAMVSLTAGTVTGPRHVDGQIVDGPTGPIGQEGYVLNVDGHRYWLPYDGTAPTQVPYSIQGRQVTIGPDGDNQPTLELIRDRPTGRHSAQTYLALGTTPELGWLLWDGDTALVTLRLNQDGLRLQNNVTGTTRYFAFRDELDRRASGTVTVSVKASAGGTAAVAFPTGRFTSADTLDISLTKLSGGLAKYIPYVSGISATGMTVGLYSGDGSTTTGSVPINWTVSVRRP